MHRNTLSVLSISVVVLVILLGGYLNPVQAVWHVLINEHFNDEASEWPWGNWTLYPDLTWSGG